jgi:ABC-2 type transport system ATP-binding protein
MNAAAPAMIEICNLTKIYEGKGADKVKKAVDGISFSVNPGEVFGFLGPNGAGKTTTIRMMIGLLKPTEGDIRIDGINVVRHPKQAHAKIGVVFELPNLYGRSTIEANLNFFGNLNGVPRNRIDELMDSLELNDRRHTKVDTLSKGWKQRVLIARALLHRPKVLFLDEPTSGLDPNTTRLIRSYIKGLKQQGTTIILTTHDMLEADELSDQAGIMHNGKLVAMDSPVQLKARFGGGSEMIVEYLQDGRVTKKSIPMIYKEQAAELLHEKILSGEIVSIHTKEATLSDVFARLTGSELS